MTVDVLAVSDLRPWLWRRLSKGLVKQFNRMLPTDVTDLTELISVMTATITESRRAKAAHGLIRALNRIESHLFLLGLCVRDPREVEYLRFQEEVL